MKSFQFLPLLLVLSGCAGEGDVRSVSAKTAVVLSEYRDNFTRFAEQQTALNTANERRLEQLQAMRNDKLAEIQARRLGWEIAGDSASVKRLDIISSVGVDQILAEGTLINPLPPPPPVPPVKYDPAAVNAVIAELNGLSQEIGILDRAEEWLAFGSGIREAIKNDVGKASEGTAQATTTTATAQEGSK